VSSSGLAKDQVGTVAAEDRVVLVSATMRTSLPSPPKIMSSPDYRR
jgi:hypothetical protein